MPKKTSKSLGQSAASAMKRLQRMATDPQLRAKIYDGLASVRMEDEALASQLEDHYLARVEFLASKIPPPSPSSPLAHVKDIPTDADATKFGRYLRAAESPLTLLEDIASGAVSPEAVETVQKLYPRLYEEMKQKTAEKLVTLKSMPYHQRAAITEAFGVNLEPSLDPAKVAGLNNYLTQDAASQPEDPQPGDKGGFTPKRKIDDQKLGPRPR